MVLPVVICFSRVHGHAAATPGALTQEVNRCLTMVRIAATRRSAEPRKMPPKIFQRKVLTPNF
jgi:hypothetical protein